MTFSNNAGVIKGLSHWLMDYTYLTALLTVRRVMIHGVVVVTEVVVTDVERYRKHGVV